MKFSSKKLAAVLFAALIAVTAFPFSVSAQEMIKIDGAHFPENKFRTFVSSRFDTDNDGYLSEDEINAVVEIRFNNGYGDTTGIEYFTNLKEMWYRNDVSFDLYKLDLSKNTKLEKLTLYTTSLEELDLSNNTKLTEISIVHDELRSRLTSLKLGSKPCLKSLSCTGTHITEIDLDGVNPDTLTSLDLSDNRLETIDISRFSNLGEIWGVLYLDHNRLTAVDMSKNNYSQLNRAEIGVNTALNYQEYFAKVSSDGTIDLTNLQGVSGFDVSKASNWQGGTVNGTTLTPDSLNTPVTYDYKCADRFTMSCTIIPVSDKALSPDFSLSWEKGSKKTDLRVQWFDSFLTTTKPVYEPTKTGLTTTVKYEVKIYSGSVSAENLLKKYTVDGGYWTFLRDFLEDSSAPASAKLIFTVQAVEYLQFGYGVGKDRVVRFEETTGNKSAVAVSEPYNYNTVNIKTVSEVNLINTKLVYNENEVPSFTAEVAAADKAKYEIVFEEIQDIDKTNTNNVLGFANSRHDEDIPFPGYAIKKVTADGNYYVAFELRPKDGYAFANDVKVSINGAAPISFTASENLLFAPLAAKVTVTPAAHSHTDADKDYICDTCGKITVKIIPGILEQGKRTQPTVNDARSALRFSVNLDKPTALQKVIFDTDFNGKITVDDARNILRVSVKLDSISDWKISKYL